MSAYCGWCGVGLSVREQNDMPRMEKETTTSTVKLDHPLCYNCREKAKREGYRIK